MSFSPWQWSSEQQTAAWLVVDGKPCPISAAQLAEHAHQVRMQVSQQVHQEWVLLTEDAYYACIASLALWSEGKSVVLCPSGSVGNLDELLANRGLLFDKKSEPALSAYFTKADRLTTSEESSTGGSPADCSIRTKGARIVLGSPALASEASKDAIEAYQRLILSDEQPIVKLFTSGSTGQPQLHAKSARQLLGEAQALGELFFPEGASALPILASVPPYHIYGFLLGVLVPLTLGAALCGHRAGLSLSELCQRIGAEQLASTPAHLESLLRTEPQVFEQLERVFSSAGTLTPTLSRELSQLVSVVELFGSTETGGIAFRSASDEPWHPLPGATVETGEQDRLKVRSPWLADARQAYLAHDRIQLVDGGFRHLGRLDGVVKVAGKRVSLRALEVRAEAVDGVSEAIALARRSTGLRGMEVLMVIATDDEHRVAPARLTLKAKIAASLAQYFDRVVLPRRYRWVDQLPRDATGKLRQERLLALFEEEDSRKSEQAEQSHEYALSLPAGHRFFDGHFDNYPVLPAVTQIHELVLKPAEVVWPKLGVVHTLERLKFTQQIRPGAELRIRLLWSPQTRVLKFNISSKAGESAASGRIKMSPQDNPPKSTRGEL